MAFISPSKFKNISLEFSVISIILAVNENGMGPPPAPKTTFELGIFSINLSFIYKTFNGIKI